MKIRISDEFKSAYKLFRRGGKIGFEIGFSNGNEFYYFIPFNEGVSK